MSMLVLFSTDERDESECVLLFVFAVRIALPIIAFVS